MNEQQRSKISVISENILNDKNLTPAEKMVYARICYFEEFFESSEATGEYLGIKAWTVKTAKRKLEKLGYIICVENTGRGKRYVADVNYGIYDKSRCCEKQRQMLVKTTSDVGENNVRCCENQHIDKNIEKNVEKKEKKNTLAKPSLADDSQQTTNDFEQEFEEIWQYCPNKQRKADGKKAYIRARKKGVSKELILTGMKKYASRVQAENTPKRYIRQGGNWFKGESWEDENNSTDENSQASRLRF